VPILKSPVVKASMQDGVKEKSRIRLGDLAEPETPLFEGGLVPSADGLSWSVPG
jgi:halogenation protein CepH